MLCFAYKMHVNGRMNFFMSVGDLWFMHAKERKILHLCKYYVAKFVFFVKKFANVDYFLYLCSRFIVRALACEVRHWKRVSDIMGLSSVWKAIQP